MSIELGPKKREGFPDDELKKASSSELLRNLDWNKTLMEHYDENMDHRGYLLAEIRVKQIEAELRRR